MKKKAAPEPDIPEEFEEVANGYNLTIDYKYAFRSFFVTDVNTIAPLLVYREYEFVHLTAEALEADIEEAIENYEPREPFDPIAHERMHERPRHLPTGHFRS